MTGRRLSLLLFDSITEALHSAGGAVIVCGSHGGASSGRYALAARPLAVVFNDAGGGLDGAGYRALAMLQGAGIAACTVGHTTARIGEAASTLATGVISHTNEGARGLGALPGMACREWVERLGAATA